MKKRKKQRTRDNMLDSILHRYGADILKSESFNRTKNFIQHGKKSVFHHSVDVAKMSVRISRLLPFKFKERDLVRGALLHDYFLYDWHDKSIKVRKPSDIMKMHGFTHPITAMRNADRDFGLSACEREIIRKHMWPLTFSPPKNREAWVVTLADKICSTKETLRRK